MIEIHLRDCNGKREVGMFSTNQDFIEWYNEEVPDDLEDYEYEIQMVIYNGHCIYSGLTESAITFEDLLGFFA